MRQDVKKKKESNGTKDFSRLSKEIKGELQSQIIIRLVQITIVGAMGDRTTLKKYIYRNLSKSTGQMSLVRHSKGQRCIHEPPEKGKRNVPNC